VPVVSFDPETAPQSILNTQQPTTDSHSNISRSSNKKRGEGNGGIGEESKNPPPSDGNPKPTRTFLVRKHGRVYDLGMTTGEERSKEIRRCVTAGFFFNVAKLGNDGRCYAIRGIQNILVIPNKSSMFHSHGTHSEHIAFCETHDGARGGIELRSASAIDAR
jgi:hypothetical protein